jgi:hypothetical protein
MQKIRSFVHKLRAQPIETRKSILIGTSFGLTALVALVWISGIAFSHTNYSVADVAAANKPTQSPFTIIKDSVVEVYANASKGYDSATQK